MEPPLHVELGPPPAPHSDDDLVSRIRSGEHALFEVVMRRHNQQLYRAARAIMGEEAEVEDILQQSYLNAFAHLDQFEARARLATWLTRIVINEAYARRKLRQRMPAPSSDATSSDAQRRLEEMQCAQPSPEHQAYAGELSRELERAVDDLPEQYRIVFMLRDVEGMSTAETGSALALGDEAVKTRLHRARVMLRQAVVARIGKAAEAPFQFHASRCNRVVAGVMQRLPAPQS